MKYNTFIWCAAIAALSSCSVNSHQASSVKTDSVSVDSTEQINTKQLTAELSMPDTIMVGDSVLLNFKVKNTTNGALRFCKWHTPFEPLLSKYLEVKNEKGEEMDYRGAMAKRIMPPPESSYVTVKAADSLATHVDLLKAYNITQAGKYTLTYVGGNMSGLTSSNSITFTYLK